MSMKTATTTTPVIDLVALLAEVEAELATDEGKARVAAYEAETAAREAAAHHAAMRRQGKTADACGRCGGSGHIEAFRHVSGGNCFACAGTGVRNGHL